MPRVFVYGAQMLHAKDAELLGGACVRDHAVRFVAKGVPVFEPGFAALEPAPGEVAYGAVLEVDEATWEEMKRFEQGYRVVEVEAEFLDPAGAERACVCRAFRISRALRSRRELRPSRRYARKMLEGARRAGLPTQVLGRYEVAVRNGSPLSLGLTWLFPIAARIGLIPLALILVALVMGLVFAVVAG